MFVRFRNLFSKNKDESKVGAEQETVTLTAMQSDKFAKATKKLNKLAKKDSKLEGLNLIKSVVESEQKTLKNVKNAYDTSAEQPQTSLSQEVAELLEKRLSKGEESMSADIEIDKSFSDEDAYDKKRSDESSNIRETEPDFLNQGQPKKSITLSDSETQNQLREPNDQISLKNSKVLNYQTAVENGSDELIKSNEEIQAHSDHEEMEQVSSTFSADEKSNSGSQNVTDDNEVTESESQSVLLSIERSSISKAANVSEANASEANTSYNNLAAQVNSHDSNERIPNSSENSRLSSQSPVKENNANSTSSYPQNDFENNLCTNSSIVVEDLPSEINTCSPNAGSTLSVSSSNTSTLDSSSVSEICDASKIIVHPIGKNGLACDAITNKLADIAEVAESLDAVIRDVQENVQSVEVETDPCLHDRKSDTLRSVSSEDWHSRSTEEDSFATASEGNFTSHSHTSSSFQSALGGEFSHISSGKNSFDAGEADNDLNPESEVPNLTSPLNVSFEGSEQSYRPAQPVNDNVTSKDEKLYENCYQIDRDPYEEYQISAADIDELHSKSLTPVPNDNCADYQVGSMPIESETELEVAGISDAPSMETLTEHRTIPMSRTPEVSPSICNTCSNRNPSQITLNGSSDSSDQQHITNKPNAAWRRSKYYENITKQTIKGFL